MTVFSIFEKIFPQIKNIMCALRAHINQTQFIIYKKESPIPASYHGKEKKNKIPFIHHA